MSKNMKKNCVLSFLFLVLFILCSVSLKGQDQGAARGNLVGTVVDKSGGVIAGARVTITGPIGTLTSTTGQDGTFSFPTLIPGYYEVRVEKERFKSADAKDVQVLVNNTATVRPTLDVGAVTETVEVVGSAITVVSTSAAVTADLPDTLYQDLPLTRSVTSIFYVAPGVASGLGTGKQNPSISGATGLENAYVADGVLLNDAAFGGLGVYQRRYGGLGTGINLSFVKEVQVNTAGFGPEIGHTTGGLVQIITKSGGTSYHGVVGGYFGSRGMGAVYANQDDFHTANQIGRQLQLGGYEGDLELGGYVPLGLLKNHLFFFGAFNPTWNDNWVQPVPGTGLFTATNGVIDRWTRVWDYSGKLTWKLSDRHSIESSVFADPTYSHDVSWGTLNIDNTSANSKQDYGSRNWATRYNATLGASLLLNAAFTWNWNKFNEVPASIYNITDDTQTAGLPGQRGAFRAQGFGSFDNYDSNTKGLQFSGSKEFTFAHQHHTIGLGYTWQYPIYADINGYSGPRYPIPTTNASGLPYLSAANQAIVTGQTSMSHLLLELAPAGCTLCPFMNVPGYATPQQVVLLQDRGIFSSGISNNTAKYHAAYISDDWEMGTHATLDLGLRWEQQRMSSGRVTQVLNDQWSPRIGFIVDPKGDRKSKIYANFGRYAWIMPLDAAIRELTVEEELNNVYYAPVSSPVGGVNMVTLNSFGTVTTQLDAAHLLNNATGGVAVNPTLTGISGGGTTSPFAPGTRMEYNDEFVFGGEHEFPGGIVISARYIDRRIKRIIEDFGGVSIEQSLAGFGQFYAIGNPNAATDVVVNPNEITFSKGLPFGATAMMPTGCYDSRGNPAPHVLNLKDTFGNIQGSACFPSVNLNPWTDATGKILKGALFGGENGADGKPDGYLDPKREYQAIEIEINKAFSHNWSLLSNWRIARLRGNFEGAFRNDNGQNDPGISSLYDFTPGLLNTLGYQFAVGPLNADRLHIVNIYPTYVFNTGILNGFTITPGVRIQTGVPLTTLAAQEAYQNFGEVPVNGRGDLGRAPVTGTVDVHLEYPLKLGETRALRFTFDMFNIANTKRPYLVNQYVDLSYGVLNEDFKKPGFGQQVGTAGNLVGGFVAPFSSRGSVRFEF